LIFEISVVIPTHNRLELCERALLSVLHQTSAAFEIIVVDDGSRDGTAEKLSQKYPDVIFLVQENKGVSAARNRGVLEAKGDWLAFLDSDDVWHKNKLESQVKALEQQPEHLFCHSNEVWQRGTEKVTQKKHVKSGGWIFEDCLKSCVIAASSVLIQKELFDTMGGFDESLIVCEDYDFWLRLTARHEVLFVEEALLTKHDGHGDQLSHRVWGLDRYRIQALENLLASGLLNAIQEEQTLLELKNKLAVFIEGAIKHKNPELKLFADKLQMLEAQGC
jgi:GT2 family glycosyltransferase